LLEFSTQDVDIFLQIVGILKIKGCIAVPNH